MEIPISIAVKIQRLEIAKKIEARINGWTSTRGIKALSFEPISGPKKKNPGIKAIIAKMAAALFLKIACVAKKTTKKSKNLVINSRTKWVSGKLKEKKELTNKSRLVKIESCS
jgi:hypothetical protein